MSKREREGAIREERGQWRDGEGRSSETRIQVEGRKEGNQPDVMK